MTSNLEKWSQAITDRLVAAEDRTKALEDRTKALEDLVMMLQAQAGGTMDQVADQKAKIDLLVQLLQSPAWLPEEP